MSFRQAVLPHPGFQPPAVDLHEWDLVILNSSGGKDSQTMLNVVAGLAAAQVFPKRRIQVIHADLGRAQWPGVVELAERQAVLRQLPPAKAGSF